jgi:serine/threonine-protein kinase
MTGVAGEREVPGYDAIARAAEDVAEGRSVDWAAVAAHVKSPEAIEGLNNLRLISAIADVHRSGEEAEALDRTICVDANHPLPDDVGEPWGRYRLLQRVGSGSFGSVYRAWDPQLEREVAVKILHRHLADDELRKRLLFEARALAKVRHPNIVSVYAVEAYEDRIGLCMEFVRGETLDVAMTGGRRLNPREAVGVGQDVCRAIAAVHAAGFVHRDVSARNIMRDLAGRIIVMDFGSGLQTPQNIPAGSVKIAGTPLYMAPEILAGEAPSPASDVYSIGVLLYYVVTGKFPVEGHTMADLRTAHMVGRRTPLAERAPDLPAAYIGAVEHALVADPRQRYPSAAALLQALDAVLLRKRTTTEYVVLGLEVLAGGAVASIALGAVNSRYFNLALGRTDFANESVLDWLRFGAQASVAPATMFLFVLFAVGLLSVAARLLLGASAGARRVQATLANVARRWRLDDVTTLSACMVLLSAAALVVTWWYFVPVLDSLGSVVTSNISTAPRETLSFLSPVYRQSHHYAYRKSFTAVVLVCLALWYLPLRLAARKGEPINRSILAGGLAIFVLSLLLLDFPYRLIVAHQRDFEAAVWEGDSCFILGERQAHLLLFCPDAAVPRNRIVRADDPNLKREGVLEDIFAKFGPSK